MNEVRQLSPDDALRTALEFQRARDYRAAASIYRQMLEQLQIAQWLIDTGRLESVCEELVGCLHEGGDPEEALTVFSHFSRSIDPVDDAWFEATYREGLRVTGMRPTPFKRRHRFHTLVQLLRSTRGVAGDVVECGCFRGLSSYAMCSELRLERPSFDGAGYHVFDSFEGLSAPAEQDRIPDDSPDRERLAQMTQAGNFTAPIDAVKAALAGFPAVSFYPGWIPNTFARLPERAYRFVHVDVDLYEPTRATLEYFFPRLSPGGKIVSDDYNWPGARRAMEEFCTARGLRFEVTPYTQAWLTRA